MIVVWWFLNKQSKKSEAPSNLNDILFYRPAGENAASESTLSSTTHAIWGMSGAQMMQNELRANM